jgi:hypothetical protein
MTIQRRPLVQPISESALLRLLLIAASEFGARLFRNQVGTYRIAQPDCKSCQRFGRTISSGLGPGSPDLVGWRTVTIRPSDVGRTIAVFVGVEAKTDTGRVGEHQRAFLAELERQGAVSGVVRSVADLGRLLDTPPQVVSSVPGDL